MSELKRFEREVSVAFWVFAICAISLIAFSFSQVDDYKAFMVDYCNQVESWESDADAGIEPSKRFGHPNYKGVACDKENK